MLDTLLAHKGDILVVALAVVTGASVLLKALAPLTKNVTDDKWLARCETLLSVLGKLALNVKR